MQFKYLLVTFVFLIVLLWQVQSPTRFNRFDGELITFGQLAALWSLTTMYLYC
jgi:hypothetical protein